MEDKKKGFCIIVPFQEYLKAKKQWHDQNPKAIIVEEIKTLQLGMAEVPHPTMIGKTTQQQMLMIAWAIVYMEEVPQQKIIAQA